MKKLIPENCCDFGEYTCQIPQPINGKVRYIDICISDIVSALNAANLKTVASCCGHGNDSLSSVVLEDGREISIKKVKQCTGKIQ